MAKRITAKNYLTIFCDSAKFYLLETRPNMTEIHSVTVFTNTNTAHVKNINSTTNGAVRDFDFILKFLQNNPNKLYLISEEELTQIELGLDISSLIGGVHAN